MVLIEELIGEIRACTMPITVVLGSGAESSANEHTAKRVLERAQVEMEARGLWASFRDVFGSLDGGVSPSAVLDFIFAQAGAWLVDALLDEVSEVGEERSWISPGSSAALEWLLSHNAERFERLLTTDYAILSGLLTLTKERGLERRGFYLPSTLSGVRWNTSHAISALVREHLSERAVLVVERSGSLGPLPDMLRQLALEPRQTPVWWCLEVSQTHVHGRRVDEVAKWGVQAVCHVAVGRVLPQLIDAFAPLEPDSLDVYLSESADVGPDIVVSEAGGVELVLVPGGVSLMGSEQGAGEPYEYPQHEVELDSFYLAKSPVTNEQYARFLADNPKQKKPRHWDNRRVNQPNQPVVGVSWEEACEFCAWAGLVLPTEAQWEYACRAGTPPDNEYWSGSGVRALAEVGWYDDNSGGRLHDVGEKQANPFLLYDMHGNVREWCRDGWDNYHQVARKGDGLRVKPENDASRPIRGGGWGDPSDACRSAYRDHALARSRKYNIGFRPALLVADVGADREGD